MKGGGRRTTRKKKQQESYNKQVRKDLRSRGDLLALAPSDKPFHTEKHIYKGETFILFTPMSFPFVSFSCFLCEVFFNSLLVKSCRTYAIQHFFRPSPAPHTSLKVTQLTVLQLLNNFLLLVNIYVVFSSIQTLKTLLKFVILLNKYLQIAFQHKCHFGEAFLKHTSVN